MEVYKKGCAYFELHLKSFSYNFWGAVQFDTSSQLLLSRILTQFGR